VKQNNTTAIFMEFSVVYNVRVVPLYEKTELSFLSIYLEVDHDNYFLLTKCILPCL